MNPAPGSFLWLLAHDIRLNWRGLTAMFGGASLRRILIILGSIAALMHLAAIPAVRWLGPQLYATDGSGLRIATVLGGIVTWMIAQSLFSATRTLFDRGDLDLLLGSPLPPARVIAAKALAIMASTLGSIALLLMPLANTGAVIDGPVWLSLYPVLIGLGLIATAFGIGLAMGLFFLVGPRRARTTAQMTGAALGGGFVLVAQVFAMLPKSMRESIAASLHDSSLAQLASAHSLLGLPVAALQGNVWAMTAQLEIGAVLFLATTHLLGERFALAAAAAAGAPSTGEAGPNARSIRFRHGINRALRVKEWRLLTRDPSLFAQLSLQIIYTIPIAVVLLRSQTVPAAVALVPTIVVIAAQVTGSIAWLTVSGEDAPELIATAPVTQVAVDRAKLSAVVLPMLAILATPLVGLASISARAAFVALIFAAGACTSTALLNFWHPMPGNRRGMLRRHQQSKLIGLVEHGLAVLWTFASVFGLIGSAVTVVPLLLVVAILAYFRSAHMRRQHNGGMAGEAVAVANVSSLPAASVR